MTYNFKLRVANSISKSSITLHICKSSIKVLRGKSFNIDGWVRVYNLFMVAVSFYLCRELWVNTMGYYYWPCEPLDHSENQGPDSMANMYL